MIIQSTLLIDHCILLGSMLFFAAVVAPSVFRFVSEREAGLFLRGMFPRYYLWGVIISLVMVPLAAYVSLWLLLSSLILLSLFVIARQVLMPAINQSRDLAKQGDTVAKNRFNRLHRVSVMINALQMLLLIAVIIHLV